MSEETKLPSKTDDTAEKTETGTIELVDAETERVTGAGNHVETWTWTDGG
jgi:hypothetical protein